MIDFIDFDYLTINIKMPSSVTILCHVKSKGLDGGFFNGLASYMIEPNNFKSFRYGYYKNQISSFLCDLSVNDYVLICGKCVFNNENMYVSIFNSFYLILLSLYFIVKKMTITEYILFKKGNALYSR